MTANNLFDVLRIDILSRDDDQILLSADDIKLPVVNEAQVARPVPAVLNLFYCEFRTIEVAAE